MADVIEELIDKYDLTAESTPCDICIAMNGLEVKVVEKKTMFFMRKKVERYEPRKRVCGADCRSHCLDKDRALIKLYFLDIAKEYLK